VEDGPPPEALLHEGEIGVGVEGVAVAHEAVEQRLLGRVVFCSTRKSGARLGAARLARGRRLAAPAALAEHDDAPLGVEEVLARRASRCGRTTTWAIFFMS
jgi:hypothetical protein